MIPDFKTFIRESIWSDIQDRSSGKIGRKEDDINLLDIREFCEYLKGIYKTTNDSNDIRILEIEDDDHKIDTYLVICLYEDETGYYRYIYYNGDYINTQLDVIETLNCRSEFERKFSTTKGVNDFDVVCIDIYPKDRARVPVTNKFFIEVLDFILDRIDAPLEQQIEKITDVKESIWSDIQDRSSGDTIRKEDDINHLDMYGLLEYIQKKYEFSKEVITLSSSIGIPLFSDESIIVYLTISYYNSCDRIYDVYSRFIYDSPLKDNISSILKQKYSVKIIKDHSASKFDGRVFALISTKPKKGDIDNIFVIDVIDTYIDIMDTLKDIDKYIKRK